jgi:ABC-2 type transport system permease protein
MGLKHVRQFAQLLTQQLKAKLEYPSDFMLQLIAMILRQGIWLAFFWVIFTNIPTLRGWNFWEIAFLYGLSAIPLGLNELFLDGSWRLPLLVRTGELDRLLVRPLDCVLHVFSQASNLHGLGNVIAGSIIAALSASEISINWTLWTFCFIALTLLSGTLIYASVMLATASLSFWTTDLGSSVPYMVNQLGEFSRFPLSLYPPLVSGLLTWIIPFAFAGFFPVAFLLGQKDWWVVGAMPVVSIMSFLVARYIFSLGLRRYESTGN